MDQKIYFSLNEPVSCEKVCSAIGKLLEKNKDNIGECILIIQIAQPSVYDRTLHLRLEHKS